MFTLLCAFAPNPRVFGVLRFLAGLGLGGVLPTALALINEYATRGRGGRATTTMMTGYHVGAVLTALLGILVIEQLGWQWMFVIGALPALVLVPLMLRYLPESTAFLQAQRTDGVRPPATATPAAGRAEEPGRHAVPARARPIHGRVLGDLVHGAAAGLRPEHLAAADHAEAGYELGAALALLLVLNVGAVLGLLVAGQVADKIGTRRSAIAWFATAALFLALLSIKLPGVGVYVSVLLTGMFVFSAQVLVYAYVAHVYPAAARGTALGSAAGIGRLGAITGPLITGVLLTAGIAYPWGFYLFAASRPSAPVAIFLVNRDPAPDEPMPVTEDRSPSTSTIPPTAEPRTRRTDPARSTAVRTHISPNQQGVHFRAKSRSDQDPRRNCRRRSCGTDAVAPAVQGRHRQRRGRETGLRDDPDHPPGRHSRARQREDAGRLRRLGPGAEGRLQARGHRPAVRRGEPPHRLRRSGRGGGLAVPAERGVRRPGRRPRT